MPDPAEPTERQKAADGRPRRPAHRLPGSPRRATTSDECEADPRRSSPSSTRSCAGSACAAGSHRSTPTRPGTSARPGGGRTHRTCPAGPSSGAPSAGSTPAAATGPRRSSRSPATATGGSTPTAPRSTRTATTTAAPRGTRSTSRRSWTGSGRTLRRCVGWEVQYFGTIEPQRRGAPHFHAALRGTIPRTELRAIAAATYHQVWWPAHDEITLQRGSAAAVGRRRARVRRPRHRRGAADVRRRRRRSSTEPAHVVTLRAAGARQGHPRRHRGSRPAHRLPHQVPHQVRSPGRRPRRATSPSGSASTAAGCVAELDRTPCSPHCPVWLLYGVQPRKVPGTRPCPGCARARPTSPNTSASPAAASSCRGSGRARPSTTTTPSGPRSFGNC